MRAEEAGRAGRGDQGQEPLLPARDRAGERPDRAVLVLLCEAYTEDESRPSELFMKFHPKLAPIKAGIFPLVNKDGMPEIAEKLYLDLRNEFTCEYDAKQTVGKRYARMDEIGTPFCVTVDGQTKRTRPSRCATATRCSRSAWRWIRCCRISGSAWSTERRGARTRPLRPINSLPLATH